MTVNFTKKLIQSNNTNIKLPYILYIPENYLKDSRLIVELSGAMSSNESVKSIIDSMIEKEIKFNSMDYMLHLIMEKLNYPVIIPIIPRIDGFYTTYLGSKIINNDFSLAKNLNEKEKETLSNLDEQIKLMIIEASIMLDIDSKAIIKGYSATAKFATQFSILHPDIVSYNISGGTGGLSCLPISEYNGIKLPYPIGIANIENFDYEEFLKVKHFFYIGSEDINNPAMPKAELSGEEDENGNPLPLRDLNGNIIYIYDTDGKLLPFYVDCYSKEEINIIHNLYGDENLERFKLNAKIYDDLGIISEHRIYDGNHRTIFSNNLEQICEDIVEFININRRKIKK
jgi:hypothetical protein